MKVSITIEGTPRVNSSINYTKKGRKHTPVVEIENERGLKASVVNRLPFDFKPFTRPVLINKLIFSFPANNSFTAEEKRMVNEGGEIEKNLKPDLIDCLRSMLKALTGTLILNDTQICRITELKKNYSARPGIILEAEEL